MSSLRRVFRKITLLYFALLYIHPISLTGEGDFFPNKDYIIFFSQNILLGFYPILENERYLCWKITAYVFSGKLLEEMWMSRISVLLLNWSCYSIQLSKCIDIFVTRDMWDGREGICKFSIKQMYMSIYV